MCNIRTHAETVHFGQQVENRNQKGKPGHFLGIVMYKQNNPSGKLPHIFPAYTGIHWHKSIAKETSEGIAFSFVCFFGF